DFAALPPEINSGRMYAGAGAGPMMTAASAWDGLASELNTAAASYRSAVSSLTTGPWLGAASASMAAAAAPYAAWMSTTANQAQQTAAQARSAASAYEAAFAETVPPASIVANRSRLASLVASNIIGQNTAAIAATETEYGEMWAQDASAMYSYAGASAAATQLTPFSAAPDTTNPAASSTQAAAVSQANSTGGLSQLVSQVPNALQGLASSGASVDPVTWLEDFLSTPVVSGLGNLVGILGNDYGFPLSGTLFVACLPGFFLGPLLALALPNLGVGGGLVSDVSGDALGAGLAEAGSAASGSGSVGLAGAEVSAGLGRAASVGGLSVPQGWGTAAPEIRLAAKSLPLTSAAGLPEVAAGGPGYFGGIPPVGSVVNAPRTGESGVRRGRAQVMAQMPGESGIRRKPGKQSTPPNRPAPDVTKTLTERERGELDELRKELVELEMERDAAARLIKEAIRP
ncbi:MAG: PPE family protein, partial [Mycobacterium sp.]